MLYAPMMIAAGLAMALPSRRTLEEIGKPEIARFYDDAEGAVSLEFDDSMSSQVENLLPLLKQWGLTSLCFSFID